MKNKQKKRSGRKRRLRFLCMFLAAAAVIAAAFLLQPKDGGPSDEQIIEKISKFDLPEGAPWITKIENAQEQARLYPALFNGTRDGQYALRYDTLFAVYDYQEDKIVRRIPIFRINIEQ